MKTCLIVPIPELVNLVEERQDHHLVLPSLCRNEDYMKFYQRRAELGDYIILDNGAYVTDGGEAWSMGALLKLAKNVGASEVVLPDKIHDATETVSLTEHACRWLVSPEGRRAYLAADAPNLMVVPQGDDPFMWGLCLHRLYYVASLAVENLRGPSDPVALGVSKVYGGEGVRQRLQALSTASKIVGTPPIHLLGWAGSFRDLYSNAELYGDMLRSVDSARPVNYARAGREVWDDESDQHTSRVEDYFYEPLSDPQRDIARSNVESFRRAARDL